MCITLVLVTAIILLVRYFPSNYRGENKVYKVDYINSGRRFLSIIPRCGNA